MFSSSLIDCPSCIMSPRRTSPRRSPSRKNPPKCRTSVPLSPDSPDRMKKASSTSVCTTKSDRSKNGPKIEHFNNSKMAPSFDNDFSKTDIPTNIPQSPLAKSPERSSSPEKSEFAEKEDDLVNVLMGQLHAAENQMQKMQSVLKKAEERLRSQDQEIVRLKRKIKDWEAKNKNQDTIYKNVMLKKKTDVENSAYLYKRCLSLEHKIFEMEKFLADYGLVWVGDSKTNRNKRQDCSPKDFIHSCYTQLMANIEELNVSVGKGEIHVERNQDGGGASFKTPSCMCLKFYKNGMLIEEGKLRDYNDPKTVSFLRDILDGYFPSELQKAYPNGVPFKVEDRRKENYLSGGVEFPGHGHRLGKQGLIGKRPSTTIVKSTTNSSIYTSKSPTNENQKKYSYNSKTGIPLAPTAVRSSKQKICPPSMSAGLLDLQSHMFASQNNSCSNSHLQSHATAELGLGNRNERKRIPAVKTTEYHLAVKGKSLNSKSRTESDCLSSRRSKTNQNSSVERSGFSSSRLEKSAVRMKSRPRSASLNSERYLIRSGSRFSSPSGNDGTPRNLYYSTSGTTTKPRVTRSATLDRNNESPIVRTINESTGKPGEFRLKIRSMNGCTVFLVHVSADDTVARLYQLLDRALVRGRHRGYKIIINGYERKRLDQFAIPLREYGISRDSVLHLVND